jgi:hypothetical protein
MLQKEKEIGGKLAAKAQRYKGKYSQKKDELARYKKEFASSMHEREQEIAHIREQVESSTKEFLSKGEKAAFLTRDLIIKLNALKKILKEEKRLANPKLITQGLKEASHITDKIYDNVRVYDLNGKLATIDL